MELKTELTGNVGKDGADYKELESGKKLTVFSLAVNDQEEKTTWYKVEAWGKMAEEVRGLKQGEFINIKGSIKIEKWEKDGKPRSQKVVTIDEMKKIEKSANQELVGNVGKAGAQYKELESGKKVAEFSIAVNHQDGKTFWLKVVAWDEMAEKVKDFKQGDFIKVLGKVKLEEWKKDGEPRSQEVITINKVEKLEKSQEKKKDNEHIIDEVKNQERPAQKKNMGMEM